MFTSGGCVIQVLKGNERGESKSWITTTNPSSGEGTTDGDRTVAEGVSATNDAEPD